MYRLTITNGPIRTVAHDLSRSSDSASISYGRLKRGINLIDALVFRLLPNNPAFGLTEAFVTGVEVLQIETGQIIFQGRVLKTSKHMGVGGDLYHEVTAEGLTGYLNDSVQNYSPMQEYTVSSYFYKLIEGHNSSVEPSKGFKPGIVTVEDITIARLFTQKKTWETMKDSLFTLGGELQARHEPDGIYLDYLERGGEGRSTTIEVAKNMRSADQDDDLTKIITRLWPLGSEDHETGKRVTIGEANHGEDYLDTGLISDYGIVNGVVKWDGVAHPATLLENARNWIATNNRSIRSYKVMALDLSSLGLDIDSFYLGDSYPVYNRLLGITDILRVEGITTDLIKPYESILEFGDKLSTASDRALEALNNAAGAAAIAGAAQASIEGVASKAAAKAAEGALQEAYSEIVTQTTSVRQDIEGIMLDAVKDYVRTGDFDQYREVSATALRVLSDGVQMNFAQLIEQITQAEGAMQTSLKPYQQYIRFDSGGITLGRSDSAMQCFISNNAMEFKSNGCTVAYFANSRMYIQEAEILSRLVIGSWVVSYEGNGDLAIDRL